VPHKIGAHTGETCRDTVAQRPAGDKGGKTDADGHCDREAKKQRSQSAMRIASAVALALEPGTRRAVPTPSPSERRANDDTPRNPFSAVATRRSECQQATQSLIAGERVENKPGAVLDICGRSMVLEARLGKTGVGPFDDSYFLSFLALDALIASRQKISIAAGMPISAKSVAPAQAVDPLAVLATHPP
jgi:hypothetical protein